MTTSRGTPGHGTRSVEPHRPEPLTMPRQHSFFRRSIQSSQRELLGNWRHELLLISPYAFPLAPPETSSPLMSIATYSPSWLTRPQGGYRTHGSLLPIGLSPPGAGS